MSRKVINSSKKVLILIEPALSRISSAIILAQIVYISLSLSLSVSLSLYLSTSRHLQFKLWFLIPVVPVLL